MTNNKDYLSQEEIDALLKQTTEEPSIDEETREMSTDDFLSTMEQDALGEIGNITFGNAATALSTLLGRKVEITTPSVSIVPREGLEEEFPHPHVAVHVKYVEGFQGINLLVIKTDDAQVIADLMLGGDGIVGEGELSEIHISAVQEAMNQMMGSAATSMSTIFNRMVNISPPGIDIMDLANGEGSDNIPQEDVFIKVMFRLTIGDLIDSSIMQLLSVSFAREMITSLMGGADEAAATLLEEPEAAVQPASHASPAVPEQPQQPVYEQPPMQQQEPAHYRESAPAQQHTPQPAYGQPPAAARNINVQPVQYANFGEEQGMHADEPNLNMLLDIPLRVTVELGRTKRLIKDILELSQGSIIELDKLAGEPVDILANNKLIAKGEVVVIDENFGVRVTEIVSKADRITKLQ